MEFLTKLNNRPKKNPLPSWGLSLKVLITSLQGFMSNLKDNIHVAQFVTKATMPTPLKVHISKVSIPRREFNGLKLEMMDDLQAEYVAYSRESLDCMNHSVMDDHGQGKIILFAHGIFYSIKIRRCILCLYSKDS